MLTQASRTVVIHQPDFLPYLGFFDRLLKSDLYVILDHVQYVSGTSKSWMNRDIIKTPQGEKWITIGVEKPPLHTPINQVRLRQDDVWRRQNMNLIRENYRKTDYFDEIVPYIEELYQFRCDRMMDFNLKSIDMIMQLLDIQIERIFSSNMEIHGSSNEMLVEILKAVGATAYLSGIGAKAYYRPEPFDQANIPVLWQDFKHPLYHQQHGDFIPYLSSIDLLLNCGIEKSREIIRRC